MACSRAASVPRLHYCTDSAGTAEIRSSLSDGTPCHCGQLGAGLIIDEPLSNSSLPCVRGHHAGLAIRPPGWPKRLPGFDHRLYSHGSISLSPIPWKSATLRVATVALCPFAIAAIWASKALVGRPALSRAAISAP